MQQLLIFLLYLVNIGLWFFSHRNRSSVFGWK